MIDNNEKRSKKYQNIKSLSKDDIDKIFRRANCESDYIVAFYDHTLGRSWRGIQSVIGYPSVSETTYDYIWKKALSFDRFKGVKNPGNTWLIWGFVIDDKTTDWHIDCRDLKFEFAKTKQIKF